MPGKPTAPHFRLSFGGDVGSNEMFSCSLSLRPDNSAWESAVTTVEHTAVLTAMLAGALSDDLFDDMVEDVRTYFADANTRIRDKAILKWVKLASLDDSGLYTGPAKEAALSQYGGSAAGAPFPHQISKKVTLLTEGDLGRVKGGFYLPCPSTEEFDEATNLWSSGNTATVQGRTSTFISDLNNAPGLDDVAFKVVIASGGRHYPDGSVKAGPALYDVTAVSVGRRADVQRRRANKVSETRSPSSTVE